MYSVSDHGLLKICLSIAVFLSSITNCYPKLKNSFDIKELYTSQIGSDFSIYAYNYFGRIPVTVIDEGNASFKFASQREHHTAGKFVKGVIKSILYLRSFRCPDMVVFLTKYNLTSSKDTIEKYDLTPYEEQREIVHRVAFVMGSKISEVNIISHELYFSCLEDIKNRCQDYILVYYAHRDETQTKVRQNRTHGI